MTRPGLNSTHAADGAPVQEAHDLRPDAVINKSSMAEGNILLYLKHP